MTTRKTAWMLGVVVALLAAQPAAATDGLSGEWLLDEGAGQTVLDSSGNGSHGRLGSGDGADTSDPTWIPGRFSGALHFDGDDFVALPDTPAMEPSRITIEAWFRRAGTPGQYRYIISKGGASCETSSYGMYSGAGGGLAFYVSDGTRYERSPEVDPASVWDGNWHHVVGTYDGEQVRLYFDGGQVGGGTPTGLTIAYGLASEAPYLGIYRGSCDLPFSGDLDLLRIWSVALTPQDIEVSLAGQRPAPAVPAAPGPGSGSGPGGTGTGSGTGGSKDPSRCYSVRVDRRTLNLNRRGRLRVTVRYKGKPVTKARVLVRGRGAKASAVTGRTGVARVVVRPRSRSRLSVRVQGRSMKCKATLISVKRPGAKR